MSREKRLQSIKDMFGVERVLWHDYETFCELDLKKVGAAVYAEHPSTEILLGAYAFDNEEVNLWDKYAAQIGRFDDPMDPPEEYLEALQDPKTLKIAWNASFEYVIMKNVLGIDVPHTEQLDPMIHAYYLSFEGNLGKVGTRVGLPESDAKLKSGRRFINTFTKPAKPTKTMPDRTRIWPWKKPDVWMDGRKYAKQDVHAMREIYYRLLSYPMPKWMWDDWALDRGINERGIPVNKAMAVNAMRLYEEDREKKMSHLRNLTELDNPNSNAQLLPWLHETKEYKFDNLQKASIGRTLNEPHLRPQSNLVIEVLETKRELAKTSVKKFARFRDGACADGTIKQSLQFGGAQRTFRWGGRQIQPQNLKKPRDEIAEQMPAVCNIVEHGELSDLEMIYGDGMGALSEAVRGCIQAPKNQVIVDADLSAIENVVLGYMSGDEKILEAPRTGRDAYLSFGVYMYGQNYETLWTEYKSGLKSKRTICKPAVLGCGYRLGAGAEYIDQKTGEVEYTGLRGYAKAMGVDLTQEQAKELVEVWRRTYSKAVSYWYDLEEAAIRCLRLGKPQKVGLVEFDIRGKFLRLRLPSGRHLHYYKAHVKKVEFYGKMIDNVHYYGLKEGKWCLQNTHGGKFTENICQAVSRDILMHGIRKALGCGLDVFLHVHDQICALSPCDKGAETLRVLEDCMQDVPQWCPGIPLSTGGIVTTHFSKD